MSARNKVLHLQLLLVALTHLFPIHGSAVEFADCPPEDGLSFERIRTVDTLYLISDAPYPTEFVYDFSASNDVHEWVENPVDNKWHTAIWLGEGHGGVLVICGLKEWIPSIESRTRPIRPVVAAEPDTLKEVVSLVNSSGGNAEIVLADGIYRHGDMVITVDNVTLRAQHAGKAILNGAWASEIGFAELDDSEVYVSESPLPPKIHQVHLKTDDGMERLSGGGSANQFWTNTSLSSSPTGGWFLANERLHVRAPDGFDPSGRIKISGLSEFAFRFTGNNIWVEGLVFEHFGINPEGSKWYDQDTVSAMMFSGAVIDVRDNIFQYNRGHALNFDGVEDVMTSGNRFLDGQSYMTYRQARNPSNRTPGRSHRSSNRVLYNRSERVTHRKNIHDYNLQGPLIAGARGVDVYLNTFSRTRNIPVELRDGQVPNTGEVDRIGYAITVSANVFERVGWSIPSNEGNAESGPVWWINNCVNEYGWAGNLWDGDTIHALQANRHGGLDNGVPLGIQIVYDNLVASTQIDESFNLYAGWNNSKLFHSGSKFLNNVWQVPDPEPNSELGTRALVWAPNPNMPLGPKGVGAGVEVKWDFNHYYMVGGNPKGFWWDKTLSEWRVHNDGLSPVPFEPNGNFGDPKVTGCVVEDGIVKKAIPGVHQNPFLFPE